KYEIVRDGVEFVDDTLRESDREEIGEGKNQQECSRHNKNLEPNRQPLRKSHDSCLSDMRTRLALIRHQASHAIRTWRTECSWPVATPQTPLPPAFLPNDYIVCTFYNQSETLLSPGILPKD